MTDERWLFELAIDELDASALLVTEFHGREAVSEGAVMHVRAVTSLAVDPSPLPGRKAVFTLREPGNTLRTFHGVVLDAAVEPLREGVIALDVAIGARIELLKLGRNCRIFQQKSVVEVVRAVLDEAGLRGDAQSWLVRAASEPQPQIVQFNESDYDFVRRLLGAEGIAFAVVEREHDEQVVFFDSQGDATDIEAPATLLDRDATQLSENVAWDLRARRRATSDQAVRRDYDPARPAVDLTASHAAPNATGREVYEHPGDFIDAARGRRLTRRVVERLQLDSNVIEGRSDRAAMRAWGRFSVESNPRAELNARLTALSVEHEGLFGDPERNERSRYANRFVAVRSTAPIRPDAQPEPAVGGAHLAWITAPAGEEIHPDAMGRVKLRYRWDRSGLTDDRSSTWARVGQLALGGSMILPRAGYEVLVDYEFGDVDRPVVTGHLYNAEAPPPYELPAGNTRSSIQSATYQGGPGANELRFEDAAGSEEIFLNASKDLTASVDHDTAWTVNAAQSSRVDGNRTLLVGTQHIAGVAGDRSLSVGGDQSLDTTADLARTVTGNASLTVGGARMVKCGGDHNENTTGALDRTVASVQAVTGLAGIQREVVGASAVRVGAAMCITAGGSFSSACGASRTQRTGAVKLVASKQFSVSCGAAYSETGAAQVVKCAGSRVDAALGAVSITAGGGTSIKAKTINLEAKSRLVVMAGGCMISLTPTSVTVKAATIDLTGAKGLEQIMHKGN